MSGKSQKIAPKESMLYLDWFLEQYECGLPEPRVFDAAMAYLQGLLDARNGENTSNLHQCISCLRSAEVIVRTLKQYSVRMPHG